VSDESFSEARAELQKLYIASFNEKIDVLSAEKDKISADFSSFDKTELRDASHKIAGSAGSYGFEKIAMLSRNLESNIKQPEVTQEDLLSLTSLLINELAYHLE